MGRKVTFTVGGGGGGGTTLILGALGVVAGILAIDHHFSKKGTSKFDRLRGGFLTGFDAPWSELSASVKSQPMQDWMKNVIQKAVDTESAATLQQLAANLAAAGLHQIADAVRAAGAKK